MPLIQTSHRRTPKRLRHKGKGADSGYGSTLLICSRRMGVVNEGFGSGGCGEVGQLARGVGVGLFGNGVGQILAAGEWV
jgi:hypothetical protein